MNIFGFNIKKASGSNSGAEMFGITSSGVTLFTSQQNASKLGNKKEQAKAYTDWVYAAVKARAEAVASVDLDAFVNRTSTKTAIVQSRMLNNPSYKKKQMNRQVYWKGVVSNEITIKNALEELDNHPLLDLLHKPNPFMTKTELIETTCIHMDLMGESFWYLMRGANGMIEAIYPLSPSAITVVPDAKNFIKGYVYRTPSGKDMPIGTNDLVQFKDVNPTDMYRGKGVVEAAALAIDTDKNAAQYNRNFYINDARPGLTIQTDKKISQDVYERLRSEWNSNYQGVDNAHRTAILEDGLKVVPMNNSQRDMEFLESRKFNRDQILALFRVSGSILGITENSNRSVAESAEYTFAKMVVKPRISLICTKITQEIAPEYDEKLIIGFDDPVPEDKEFKLSHSTQSVNKWKTVNEVRESEGLEPIEGGDKLLSEPAQPQMPQPNEKPQEELDTEDDTNEPDDGKDVTEGLKLGNHSKNKGLSNAPAMKSTTKNNLYKDYSQREIIGSAWCDTTNKTAMGYETDFRTIIVQASIDQKNAALKGLKKQLKKNFTPTVAKKTPDVLEFDDYTEPLAKGLSPIYKAEIKEASQLAGLLISFGGVDYNDPNIIKFIESRSLKVAKGINDETEKQLKATLAEGINKGEGIDKLSERLSTVFDGLSGYRAERIARTESIAAASFAQEEAWSQSGVVEGKEWFTAKDERVCEFCGPMDGDIRWLDQAFHEKGDKVTGEKGGSLNTDFGDINGAPLHANCRCTLLPIVKD